MISIVENGNVYELRCKSTDTKPTTFANGKQMTNGSALLEMDTGDVYMFDAASNQWVKL